MSKSDFSRQTGKNANASARLRRLNPLHHPDLLTEQERAILQTIQRKGWGTKDKVDDLMFLFGGRQENMLQMLWRVVKDSFVSRLSVIQKSQALHDGTNAFLKLNQDTKLRNAWDKLQRDISFRLEDPARRMKYDPGDYGDQLDNEYRQFLISNVAHIAAGGTEESWDHHVTAESVKRDDFGPVTYYEIPDRRCRSIIERAAQMAKGERGGSAKQRWHARQTVERAADSISIEKPVKSLAWTLRAQL